jgi:hypothetical protein
MEILYCMFCLTFIGEADSAGDRDHYAGRTIMLYSKPDFSP